VNVQKYDAYQWSLVSEDTHLLVFNEYRPKDMSRIDFSLVVWEKTPLGYITCREFDSETIYISYGGGLDKSYKILSGYKMLLDYLKQKYKRATTLVENTNISMIKMAMSQGFLVTGIKNIKNHIYLELVVEWG
jgi:hypothetical protein